MPESIGQKARLSIEKDFVGRCGNLLVHPRDLVETKPSMQVALVMSVIGKDRPGLVESIASIVARHGGNWDESRMCRLGGEFAGILRVHVDSDKQPAMVEELKSLQERGLSVTVCHGRDDVEIVPSWLAELELMGQDRPGIVREISHALASKGVNVEELTTECCSAPMSGETLFKAQAKLRIPESCSVSDLRQELERIAGNLVVDVTLKELDSR
jgi:glycine cleavage system regulatory protein